MYKVINVKSEKELAWIAALSDFLRIPGEKFTES